MCLVCCNWPGVLFGGGGGGEGRRVWYRGGSHIFRWSPPRPNKKTYLSLRTAKPWKSDVCILQMETCLRIYQLSRQQKRNFQLKFHKAGESGRGTEFGRTKPVQPENLRCHQRRKSGEKDKAGLGGTRLVLQREEIWFQHWSGGGCWAGAAEPKKLLLQRYVLLKVEMANEKYFREPRITTRRTFRGGKLFEELDKDAVCDQWNCKLRQQNTNWKPLDTMTNLPTEKLMIIHENRKTSI